MLNRMRTISETYQYIKKEDIETAITPFALRRMVKNGTIPSVKSGSKHLIKIDKLSEYLSRVSESEGYGEIRTIDFNSRR